MTVFFLDSTKTMIWIWKFGDQILALNERPYDVAASRWPTPSQWNCCWNRIPSCMGMMTNVTLLWMIIIIVKISSCDDADFRVKIETGNGAGNQLVTLLKQFSQQWIFLQGNIKIYLHSLNKCFYRNKCNCIFDVRWSWWQTRRMRGSMYVRWDNHTKTVVMIDDEDMAKNPFYNLLIRTLWALEKKS